MVTDYSIEAIIAETARQFVVPADSICNDPQIRDLNSNKPRLAAVWLARQLAQSSDDQVAFAFNVPSMYVKSMLTMADQLIQVSRCKRFYDRVSSIRGVLRYRVKAAQKQCSSQSLDRLEATNGVFRTGDAYRATVIAVRESGVNVRMPSDKGSGLISTRCWGKGGTRAQALAKIKVGDRLDVVVKSYDPNTMTLSLVLKGCEQLMKPIAKSVVRPAKKHRPAVVNKAAPVRSQDVSRKPAYRPLAKGTTLLFDTANLIGKLGPVHAAERLAAIVSTLAERGYKALLFWECRSFGWTLGHQVCTEDVATLKQFAHNKNVSFVREEADLALLQAVKELPDSVIVTGDHLADYAEVFPEIVATSRHRSFSVVSVENCTLLMISGLKDAIVFSDVAAPESEVAKESDEWQLDVDEEVLLRRAVRPQIEACRHGLLGVADGCILHGDIRRGLELLGRVARKEPKVYREMADVFGADNASPEDVRTAIRYDRLADRLEKAKRERSRRKCRQRAERRRHGNTGGAWSLAA